MFSQPRADHHIFSVFFKKSSVVLGKQLCLRGDQTADSRQALALERALAELLEAHREGRVNAMTKIWSFYCFIEWYELYFVEPWPPRLQKI